eukprot:GHVU01059418.1.p1 GENE.GHVU01059418.1~~GHVU01059418.1.p1  ORF type:complete len:175 (-),score=10.68 GHVU01059418.1:193-717(-)
MQEMKPCRIHWFPVLSLIIGLGLVDSTSITKMRCEFHTSDQLFPKTTPNGNLAAFIPLNNEANLAWKDPGKQYMESRGMMVTAAKEIHDNVWGMDGSLMEYDVRNLRAAFRTVFVTPYASSVVDPQLKRRASFTGVATKTLRICKRSPMAPLPSVARLLPMSRYHSVNPAEQRN